MLAGSCFCYCCLLPVQSKTLDLTSVHLVLVPAPVNTLLSNVPIAYLGFT